MLCVQSNVGYLQAWPDAIKLGSDLFYKGVLVFEKPCGVVVGVRELFGAESKSQVYGHLHTLFVNGKIGDVGKYYFSVWLKTASLPQHIVIQFETRSIEISCDLRQLSRGKFFSYRRVINTGV